MIHCLAIHCLVTLFVDGWGLSDKFTVPRPAVQRDVAIVAAASVCFLYVSFSARRGQRGTPGRAEKEQEGDAHEPRSAELSSERMATFPLSTLIENSASLNTVPQGSGSEDEVRLWQRQRHMMQALLTANEQLSADCAALRSENMLLRDQLSTVHHRVTNEMVPRFVFVLLTVKPYNNCFVCAS